MTQHCKITDNDGDIIELETAQPVNTSAFALISVWCSAEDTAFGVSLKRNQLLELKKAVDAAYREIDK